MHTVRVGENLQLDKALKLLDLIHLLDLPVGDERLKRTNPGIGQADLERELLITFEGHAGGRAGRRRL